jgi:hypothetical protein
MEKWTHADIRPIERGGEQDIEIEEGKRGISKSVLSVLPNFIALIPCRFSRKTRVKTIPNKRTIVRAPKYFGIGVFFVRVVTAKTIARWGRTSLLVSCRYHQERG